jgi:arylsulfatase A-like enzyme
MRIAAALLAFVLGGTPPADKPNIVFILADDLGVNDLSCYGRRDQSTPHLDRLAAQGMRFTAATCAQPICSPSRAALMTGKSPARLHLTTFLPGRADAPSQMLLHPKINMQLAVEEVTIAERLKAAGYATACIGKWHLGGKGFLPTDQGFDVYFPGKANTKPTESEGGKGEFELTARAEQFIEENKGRPFYLYLPHNNPHIPLAAQAPRIEKRKDSFNPLYAAVVETLDDAVGRIMARLDALGLAERTLFVFTSDNGGLHVLEFADTPATHNTPYRAGKGFVYEGGLRIPLIVRWPGRVKAGAVVDTSVINTDWVPTLLEIAGIQDGGPFDGSSLAGLLTGGEPPAARPLFWHFPHYTNQGSRPAGAVREGDWKLVEHIEDGRCELFNLAADPGEAEDLSAREPARVAALRGKLEAWRRSVGAQGNAANPGFRPAPWAKLYRDVDPSRLALEPKAATMAEKSAAWRALMNAVLPGRPEAAPGAGAIVLHARDARVTGKKLRYEDPPHKDTIGFWTDPSDFAEWEFDAPKAGTFEVEVLQGCGKGSGGAEVEVSVAGQALAFKVEETGHFQRFVPRGIGTVKVDQPGRLTLAVRAKSKPGPAVMDLRRVTLRAAP